MKKCICLFVILLSIPVFCKTTINVPAVFTQVISPTGNITTVVSCSDNRIFSDVNVVKIKFDGDKYVVEYK